PERSTGPGGGGMSAFFTFATFVMENSSDAWLKAVQRDVNCLADPSKQTRQRSLDRLQQYVARVIETSANDPLQVGFSRPFPLMITVCSAQKPVLAEFFRALHEP